MRRIVPALLATIAPFAAPFAAALDIGPQPIDRRVAAAEDPSAAVAELASNQQVRALFGARGLDLLSLTWEDTGRWKDSSVGPNISDLTIQLVDERARAWSGRGLMPVVRYPNFADKSCDVPIDRLRVLVGNEHGSALRAIDLGAYLRDFASYQHAPTGRLKGSLIGDRDRVALVSAQACFLPVPSGGEARFAPVLFNYQSQRGAPAVLTIMATPEGTSAQVIDDASAASAGVWHGQRLFHNRDGQRAALRATRFSDHRAQAQSSGAPIDGDAATRDGLSLVLIVQVPLVHPEPKVMGGWAGGSPAKNGAAAPAAAAPDLDKRGVETAVIESGPVEGPWLGLDGCSIERDWRFPIRVTAQFYQATDSSTVTDADADRIAKAIERIYLDADAVGSLVVDGMTGRPTEHQAQPPREWPQPWWQEPCVAYTGRHGEDWHAALARVRARLGADWQPADARQLANALELVAP